MNLCPVNHKSIHLYLKDLCEKYLFDLLVIITIVKIYRGLCVPGTILSA